MLNPAAESPCSTEIVLREFTSPLPVPPLMV